jgi:hypothetical protein
LGLRAVEDDISPAFLQMRQGELDHQKCSPNIVPNDVVEILNAISIGFGSRPLKLSFLKLT